MAQREVTKTPSSWEICSISYIVSEANTGLVRSSKEQFIEGQYPYIKMNNLTNTGKFDFKKMVYVDAIEKDLIKGQLFAGDFVFNTRNSAELVGKCGVFNGGSDSPILFNNNLLRMRFSEILPETIAYWFNSPLGKQALSSITSATTNVAAIYQKSLLKLEVPIPPLPEQKRIVEKLDSLLAQVDTIQQRLNTLPNIIKRFRQSVLAAAVSGKLTEQWRNDNEIADWDEVTLGDVIDIGPKKPKQLDEDLVSFSPMAMMPKLLGEELVSEVRKWKEVKKGFTCFKNNDVLLAKITPCFENEKSVIAKGLKNGIGTGSTEFMVLRPNGKMLSYLIFCHVKSLSFLKDGEMNMSGSVGHRRVPKEFVENWSIGLPLIEEQTEIVRLVEQYFALADTLEKHLKKAKQRVDNLTQAILAKAFKGELLPQDPNDEPADKLLARIAIARKEAEALAKAAKKAAGGNKRPTKTAKA
ncbi:MULTISPECIES: restriction endonuclease subunit S [unclassified Shewanella]|uniref:restriction endonuclease subunit S n=1 Tax=unclassified Shewanella TaxID=196818 RepID=UPI00354FB593